MHVLLVEDNEPLAENFAEILTLEGFPATIASDGEEGLKLLRSGREFGAVLTDHRLPKLSGLEMLQRCDELGICVPAIVTTAFPADELRAAAQALGVVEVLGKPVNVSALLEILRDVRRDAKEVR